MISGVRITLDVVGINRRVAADKRKAIIVVSNELLKDANFFCREDSGELIRSSIKASQPEKGILRWNTPYAKKMYYTGFPSKDKNPNATLMWAEQAAKKNRRKYKKMYQAVIKRGI